MAGSISPGSRPGLWFFRPSRGWSRGIPFQAEILDLRTLLPLDVEAVLETVKKVFEDLDAPILRVTAPDTPVPYSPPLEEAFLPNTARVLSACRDLLAY